MVSVEVGFVGVAAMGSIGGCCHGRRCSCWSRAVANSVEAIISVGVGAVGGEAVEVGVMHLVQLIV